MPTEFASVPLLSLGKRTLKYLDYGKTAATFVSAATGCAVRVAAREDAREGAMRLVPAEADRRRAMLAAYRVMSEASLFTRAPRHPIRFMTALITRPGARADDVGVGPDRVGMRRG